MSKAFSKLYPTLASLLAKGTVWVDETSGEYQAIDCLTGDTVSLGSKFAHKSCESFLAACVNGSQASILL